MNIFYTSPDPTECARFLDDKRVIKMVLETTQLLCTALNHHAGEQVAPYKSTHTNHPCAVWARLSSDNWTWLLKHAYALCDEYSVRYGRTHKCQAVLDQIAELVGQYLPPIGPTPLPNCARNLSLDLDCTHIEDVNEAYELYLTQRWSRDKRQPTWYGHARAMEVI